MVVSRLLELSYEEMKSQTFDCLALGIIDFSAHSYESFQYHRFDHKIEERIWFFDLASLTKPLTLGLSYLKYPDYFNEEMILLLEHRGGLPCWGRLSKKSWKEQILSYPIISSKTCYSDFSALRLMLELEVKIQQPFKDIISDILNDNICYWNNPKSNSEKIYHPPTGYRHFKTIQGDLNDDNGFVIGETCSHAGLFGSIQGVCDILLYMNQKYNLLSMMERDLSISSAKRRFIKGWDTVQNIETTLAGKGVSLKTFGHLGFTGTSIWIDLLKKRGHVILTNATQNYIDKTGLNQLRRRIGEAIWKII